MKKDLTRSVRINRVILEALEKNGWTLQKLLDDIVERVVEVKTTVRIKK